MRFLCLVWGYSLFQKTCKLSQLSALGDFDQLHIYEQCLVDQALILQHKIQCPLTLQPCSCMSAAARVQIRCELAYWETGSLILLLPCVSTPVHSE